MLHRFRRWAFLVVALTTWGTAGCVARGDFLRKQVEADSLHRELSTATAQNGELRTQIERLTAATERLDGERNRLVAARDRLTAEKDRIAAEKSRVEQERTDLTARLEKNQKDANQTIERLRNQIVELEGDKQMLSESISLLKKSKETEVRKVSDTYETLLAEMKDEIEEGQIAVSNTYETLLAEMKGEIEEGKIAITELQGKLTVDVVDRILFDSGQAEIRAEGLAILKRVVHILMTATDKVIRVEGHTDSKPIGGVLSQKYPTNWELSAARALNVTRYLQQEGIDPSLLSAVAFGEYRPLADNTTAEGRAKNRRIAIVLLPKD